MRQCVTYLIPAALAVAALGCATEAPTAGSGLTPTAARNEFPESGGVTILADNFDRAPLNPERWTVSTEIPQGGARVTVDEGHAILVNRGYLTTVRAFPPGEMGGIRVSGDWTFAGAPDDFLQILTRTTGVPSPENAFGETGQGIEFLAYTSAVFEDPNRMDIFGRGLAAGTVEGHTTIGTLTLTPGKTYHFEILDDGRHLRFTVTDLLDPTQSRTLTAQSGFRGSTNHVTFHNRESCCLGTHRAFIDNVRIERREH